jgi:hypothetical protein
VIKQTSSENPDFIALIEKLDKDIEGAMKAAAALCAV